MRSFVYSRTLFRKMYVIFKAILMVASCVTLVIAPNVFGETWPERLTLVESCLERGNTDSAKLVFGQVVDFEETRFGRSDSTVDIRFYEDGVSCRRYYSDFAEAEQLYARLVDVSEKLYGSISLESALNLRKLGAVLVTLGKYREAKDVFQRAFSTLERLVEAEPAEMVGSLNDLGEVLCVLDEFDEADSISTLAGTAARLSLSVGHPEIARSFIITGRVHKHRGRFALADSALHTALEILESKLGPEHPDVAACLCLVGTSSRRTSNHDKAEATLRRSLEIREAVFGPEHVEVASSLLALGMFYFSVEWRVEEAEKLLDHAVTLLRNFHGPDHPRAALAELCLAYIKVGLAKFEEAGNLAQHALPVLEQALGPNHSEVASAAHLLAQWKMHVNQLRESIVLFERAVAILEAGGDSASLQIANVLSHLGGIYELVGRQSEADSVLTRAYAIAESAGDSSFLANIAIDLGAFYSDTDKRGSQRFYKTALAIVERLYNGEHPIAVFALNGLAACFIAEGEVEQAEACLLRAVSLSAEVFEPTNVNYAVTLAFMANNYLELGRFDIAEEFFARGHSLMEGIVGPDHISCSGDLRNLAAIYAALRKYEESLRCFEKLIDVRQRQIKTVFGSTSEREKTRFVQTYYPIFDDLLSLTLRYSTVKSRELSLEMVLKGKAVVEEASMAERQTVFCSNDSSFTRQQEHLRDISSAAANIILSGSSDKDSLAALYAVRDSIEIELSRRCLEFETQLGFRNFTVFDIAAALPENAVLLEFIMTAPFDIDSARYEAKSEDEISWHYIALTLTSNGETSITDLGSSGVIDSLIESARRIIYESQGMIYSSKARVAEASLNRITARLRELVLDRLMEQIGDKTTLYVSSDGILNLLPFEILPLVDSSYLVEKYGVTYLSSGRDILRFGQRLETSPEVVIMADPDFEQSVPVGNRPLTMPETAMSGRPVSSAQARHRTSGCLEGPLSRLSYSRREGHSIANSFREHTARPVMEFYGKEASEDNLKRMAFAPGILHVVTHGYFCPHAEGMPEEYENALLRSGLLLAGYNSTLRAGTTDGEDGVLTACEVSGLNLDGTALVTLSACESGMAEGEYAADGLYGLRRAFQHAGAQAVLMSLWRVPDRETRLLMEGFYERWLSGSTKQDALRQSALSLLAKCRAEMGSGHPLLWGGFILTGNPN